MNGISRANPAGSIAFVGFIIGAAVVLASASAHAGGRWDGAGDSSRDASLVIVPASGRIEIAFSPNEGAEALVLRVIRSAAHPGGELRVLAYSFTSGSITHAMLLANQAGADIKVVVDARECGEHDRTGKAARNLAQLAAAGVDVRTVETYLDMHDKVVVADERTVQTGSYNVSDASAHANSENVVVLWDNPQAAQAFLSHFHRNYLQAVPLRPAH